MSAPSHDLETYRHSASHVLAHAVKRLFPETKLAIGPAIADGFYYDFDREASFTPEDLERIEEEMHRIVKENLAFVRQEVPKEEAVRLFREMGEVYKLELLEEIGDDTVTLYRDGEFVDLCRGPHIQSTGQLKAFKLTGLAGAYWRGDEKRKMLQRIYGTAFFSQEELEEHLARLEEAQRRDHRRLGRELDLYSVHEDIGAGLILWHPKGAVVRSTIEDFWRAEHARRGYQLVYTPHIASERIYQRSGHLENYVENMYSPMEIEGVPYRVKPMNCPGHILIFKSKVRSYRELPVRYAELGTVYRYERSGVLHGMLRVRGFTQDDAHIFCTPEQLQSEIQGVLELADFMMRTFGYEYNVYLATRPEKYIGTDEQWERATEALRKALAERGLSFQVDEGGGVFYGPKIDIKLIDALGREWQGPTIQVDFTQPERFEIDYIGPDNSPHRVVMIHRTVLGSMERFIGGLIEHYAGAFPVWLAPVQAVVMNITDQELLYAERVEARLREAGVRAQLDGRGEKIGAKIRDAQLQKVPYMLIIGKREVSEGTVSVRTRDSGDRGPAPVEEVVAELVARIRDRR